MYENRPAQHPADVPGADAVQPWPMDGAVVSPVGVYVCVYAEPEAPWQWPAQGHAPAVTGAHVDGA